jgi:hypothetical protein
MVPIVFVDEPGGSYWRDWFDYVTTHLAGRGLIDPTDLNLFCVTDSVDTAVQEIEGFYRNYHSSRYVDGRLVLRLHVAPDDAQLELLNDEFARLLESGRIERALATSMEESEMPHCRGRLPFQSARDRALARADRSAERAGCRAGAPFDARRRAIFDAPLPPGQVEAEEDPSEWGVG